MTGGADASWLRPLGSTGLTVSAVTAGGGPLGSMPENFGYEVSEADAIAVVEAILASPIRAIDTANGYSEGASEHRIGEGIARGGGVPRDFLIGTKVDAKQGDYSGARVRDSVRESQHRLGVEHLPLVYLHDPEFFDFDVLSARDGAVETLVRLRDEGVIGHIGLAGGNVHTMSRYLRLGVFEVLLVHNRWTLVDHSAQELISQARDAGIAIVNAAIYGGGILARPTAGLTDYGYRPADPATLSAIQRLAELCERWNTDLASVALRASVRDPEIATTIVGFTRVERLATIIAAAGLDLPQEFWDEAESLLPSREHWLDFAPSH